MVIIYEQIYNFPNKQIDLPRFKDLSILCSLRDWTIFTNPSDPILLCPPIFLTLLP